MRRSVFVLILLGACSSNKDPFANTPDGSDSTGDAKPADASVVGGDGGPHQCVAAPERVIVVGDSAKFPGGATLLMNTQYNPFDDCTASPYNVSAVKIGVLHMFNDQVKAIAAAHPVASIVVDQHKPFLGHGHHYNVMTCPYYMANAVSMMQD